MSESSLIQFNDLVQYLETAFLKPLPGEAAQMKMSPLRNIKRRKVVSDRPIRNGGVLILLYPHEGDIYLPLMERPDYEGAHGGQVSFPGGKFEEGDGNLIGTALREAQEEIGVDASSLNVLGTLSELYVMASNFNVLPVVAYAKQRPDFIPDPYEVRKIIEVKLSDLLNAANVKRAFIKLKGGYSIDSPYYDIEGHVVWGATAMMLSEFLCLIKPAVQKTR